MSAACVIRNVSLRVYNGRYISRLCGVRSNCELCNCKIVTRSFSTRRDRCAFIFYRQFMNRVRVRVTSVRPMSYGLPKKRNSRNPRNPVTVTKSTV